MDAVRKLLGAELARRHADLDRTQSLMTQALPTLVQSAARSESGVHWPYDIPQNSATGPNVRKGGSPSTVSMVGHALAVYLGLGVPDDPLAPGAGSSADLFELLGLTSIRQQGLDLLKAAMPNHFVGLTTPQAKPRPLKPIGDAEKAVKNARESLAGLPHRDTRRLLHEAEDLLALAKQTDRPEYVTQSTLFGLDDPFTVCWTLSLAKASSELDLDSHVVSSAVDLLGSVTTAYSTQLKDPSSNPGVLQAGIRSDGKYVDHMWPLVRKVHALMVAGDQSLSSLSTRLGRYFADEISRQLAHSEVADASFDICQLVAATEGLILVDRQALSQSLQERILGVICDAAGDGSVLQPMRPFKVTSTGGVHIPTNVEVYASLTRLCWRLDDDVNWFPTFHRLRPVFERYTQWLQSALSFAENGDVRLAGWASDHEYFASDRVEIWHTSQTLLYLFNYRELLNRYLASEARREVGVLASLPGARQTVEDAQDSFDKWDPELGGATEQTTYRRLLDEFVLPRLGTDRSSDTELTSFMLHGPPGTGKSSLAKAVARALGWPLLPISPSNFVVGGSEQVEDRATRLFEALKYQENCVIFFDEIDRLILDRDLAEYQNQEGMFQMMTPSMLTKLADLHEQSGVIFVLATNYAWRIDRAIIRPGRIDERFLILPPCYEKRRDVIHRLVSENVAESVDDATTQRAVLIAAGGSALLSQTELDALSRQLAYLLSLGESPDDACRSALEGAARAATLQSYVREMEGIEGQIPQILLTEARSLVELVRTGYTHLREAPEARSSEDWFRETHPFDRLERVMAEDRSGS